MTILFILSKCFFSFLSPFIEHPVRLAVRSLFRAHATAEVCVCVCLILKNASYGNDYECFKVRVLHRGIFKNISMRKKNRVFHLTEAPIHFRQTHNFDEVISSVAVRGYVFH